MCGQCESYSRPGQLHRFVSVTLPRGFMHVRLRSGGLMQLTTGYFDQFSSAFYTAPQSSFVVGHGFFLCLVHTSNFLLSPSNLTNVRGRMLSQKVVDLFPNKPVQIMCIEFEYFFINLVFFYIPGKVKKLFCFCKKKLYRLTPGK